jgi:sortase (surface protein transpeptidase)
MAASGFGTALSVGRPVKAAVRALKVLAAACAAVVALTACAGPARAPVVASSPAATAAPSETALPPTNSSSPMVPRRSAALEDNRVVAPPAPTRLEIPDLGIDVAVKPVGLDAQGDMALFDDPSVAGWYQWGPSPGSDAGSTVVAAHVDSLEYDLLPFARLKNAAAGTAIFVTDAAGTRHTYAVETLTLSEKAAVDWAAAFDRAGPRRLTLVTCGGEFDRVNRRYLANLLLTAARVG